VVFPANFLTQTLHLLVFVFFSPKRATHHDHSILLGFINIISGEQCKSRNCALQFFILLLLAREEAKAHPGLWCREDGWMDGCYWPVLRSQYRPRRPAV